MWSIFLGTVLGCVGVLAVAFTLFVLIALIVTIKDFCGNSKTK